jgi:hypothetical protein
MLYKQTTQVPNFLFDAFLPQLTESELKVLLTVIRQTLGWLDKRTGQRKLRDRISSYQFQQKTGLSRRVITTTIQSLLHKNLLLITDSKGAFLCSAHERQGKSRLYYSIANPAHKPTSTCAESVPELVQNLYHNKTNPTKPTVSKLSYRLGHIGKFLPRLETLFQFMKK